MTLPDNPSPDRTEAVLACIRGQIAREAVARQFGVSVTDVEHWEAEFIRAGKRALAENRPVFIDLAAELIALNAVNQSLGAILDLEELLETTADTLRLLFGYIPVIGIIEGTQIVIKAGYGLNGQRLQAGEVKLPLTQKGIITWSALNGQLLNVRDTAQDDRHQPGDLTGGVRSELAMPIMFKGTVLGVLSIRSSVPNAFGQRDVSILETIAFHIGVSIENALLFQQVDRRIRQLELLQSVTTQAIGELDEQAVLNYTVQATLHIMGYSSVGIGLFGSDRTILHLTTMHKLPTGQIESEISQEPLDTETIMGAAARAGALRLVKDVAAEELRAQLSSSRAALVVPIRSQGDLVGVINVESDRPDAFDNTDMATLNILAAQLAIAIRGIRLFQQTQAQLREISLFRRLADEAIVGILTRDVSGVIEYANRAAAALLGFPDPAALSGTSVRALYPDEHTYQLAEQLGVQAMVADGWSGEIRQQRQDGKAITVDMSLFPIYKPDGQFDTYGMILQDVTERRALIDATEHANARFKAIFEAATDGFIVWDETWRVIMVNPAAARLLDHPPEALVGQSRAEWAADPRLAAVAEAEENAPLELLGSERRVVRCRSLPWHSGSASGFLTVIYDMTSRVALEESREETISMLVHDLRSPLTSVIGGLQLAQTVISEDNDQERALHFLKMALRGIQRVLDVANSLLDITKLEAGQMQLDCEPLYVRPILEDVISSLENSSRNASITVRLEVASDLPLVFADESLVRRALLNLLDNAIKFSPNNSQITLAAQREGAQAIRFSVTDQGPGISEQFRQVIFEKYGQIPGRNGRRRGTGLGLALCRLVAEAHRGRIWVEPAPDGGSTFAFTVQGCPPADE